MTPRPHRAMNADWKRPATHVIDQASGLRAAVQAHSPRTQPVQVVAVSSGKGGVGKTNVVTNLAVACAKHGRKVLVMDADLALGNVDILLGLAPSATIEDVLTGDRTLEEVIIKGPEGISILPAASGIQELSNLTYEQQLRLQAGFLQLSNPPDLLMIDCAAGISSNVLYFSLVAHDTLIVVSPEPGSLTDAYALIKILSTRYHQQHFRLLVNMVRKPNEGREVFRKLSLVTDRFLNVSLDFVGWIPFDDCVPLAVSQQRPVLVAFPRAMASRALSQVGEKIGKWTYDRHLRGGYQLFGSMGFGPIHEEMGKTA
ncbi:MAG: MinD/ParA family protein [Nitrospirales bacterium]|nr:MinD/ParA family protein [Nitrospira sp.]MDR4502291.1 MinD/ParA family protein [Nitrospirales bacterium]